eukprot:GHVH01003758.1.p1 GENE.GHVH01003758.1~~GHVH01003758.1.p1  ORF type:complete len:202 (-),score=32.17 GHVH01003758.1:88-693(-)
MAKGGKKGCPPATIESSAKDRVISKYPFKLRRMEIEDVYKIGLMNIDHFIENFTMAFYLDLIVNYPAWQYVILDAMDESKIVGYVLARPERYDDSDKFEVEHGHIAAVAVAAEYRSLGGGQLLIKHLYDSVIDVIEMPFIDLYVRSSNVKAINFYKQNGYDVYAVMDKYYSCGEDGLDMRIYCPDYTKQPRPLSPNEYGRK